MKLVKLVLMVVLLLADVFGQEMDADNWREGITENKWPDSDLIQDILSKTRKPGPRQYLGRPGKKYFASLLRARKRHKFQTFVGLMGKRSFDYQGAM